MNKRITTLQSKIIKIESVNEDLDSMKVQHADYITQVDEITNRLISDESVAIENKEKIKKANIILSEYDTEVVADNFNTLTFSDKDFLSSVFPSNTYNLKKTLILSSSSFSISKNLDK